VADLVRASSLAAVKTSPQKCLLVAGFKAAFPCTTHTPVSFRSPAQHTKQGKHAKAKQKKNAKGVDGDCVLPAVVCCMVSCGALFIWSACQVTFSASSLLQSTVAISFCSAGDHR
jgi:hypothetical protein